MKKGFTLIEVIVAIVVIAVISLGGFEFFKYCRIFTVDTEFRLMDMNRARGAMEEVYMDPEPKSSTNPDGVWEKVVEVTDSEDEKYKIIKVKVVPKTPE